MAKLKLFFHLALFGAFLAAPVALFAAFTGNATDVQPVSVSPVPIAAKTQSAKQQEEQPAENPDSMVMEILQRPLFSASRQGTDKSDSEEAEQQAPPPPPQLPGRLAGMSIRPDGRQALFENQGQRAVAVNEGQQIGGWTVTSIQPDRVVLRNAVGEQVMMPAKATRSAPVVAAQSRKASVARKRPAAAQGPARPQPAVAPQAQRPGQARPPGR